MSDQRAGDVSRVATSNEIEDKSEDETRKTTNNCVSRSKKSDPVTAKS